MESFSKGSLYSIGNGIPKSPEGIDLLMTRSLIARLFVAVALPCCGLFASAGDAFAQAENAEAQQAQQLNQILIDWFNASKTIDRLEGEHQRFVYNFVFGVEKRAKGRFFYKGPDHGRIDLAPDAEGRGQTVKKTNPETGKIVELKVQPDLPERWVCDGTQIIVIDDVAKEVQQFNLPKEARGVNIMDGPLPFLFGMPPEKAKERYHLRLLGMNRTDIDLFVRPKLKKDLSNYKWARIRIERATMLPKAVQMMDPAGSRETVYTFPKITKNPKPGLIAAMTWWKDKDPFKPNLKGYTKLAALDPQSEKVAAGRQTPAVVGFEFKKAQQLLKRAGFNVKFRKGSAALNKDLVYRVEKQNPRPREPAGVGDTVWLTLYMPSVQQTGAQTPESNAPSGALKAPSVKGLHWKEAEKVIRAAGFVPAFVRGVAPRTNAESLTVYDQAPASGTAIKKGETLKMKIFVNPSTKAKAKK